MWSRATGVEAVFFGQNIPADRILFLMNYPTVVSLWIRCAAYNMSGQFYVVQLATRLASYMRCSIQQVSLVTRGAAYNKFRPLHAVSGQRDGVCVHVCRGLEYKLSQCQFSGERLLYCVDMELLRVKLHIVRYYPYTTLHYTSLHYTILHYSTLHYTALHYTTLHFTSLHYRTLHHSTLHYTKLHYTALHYNTIHYTVFISPPLELLCGGGIPRAQILC